MRELGILLVVWGLALPPVAFPLFRNYFPDTGLLGSLPQMLVFVGDIEIPYVVVFERNNQEPAGATIEISKTWAPIGALFFCRPCCKAVACKSADFRHFPRVAGSSVQHGRDAPKCWRCLDVQFRPLRGAK